MTKKKKLINGIIFIAGLIVFVVYYFKDNRNMDDVEKKQEVSADSSAYAPTGLDAIDKDVMEFEAEQGSLHDVQDSINTDSL